MGCHVQHACVRVILIASLEIILGIGGHERSRDWDVLVIGNVYSRGIIHLVVGPRRNRETGDRPLAVVEHGMDVRREHALVSLVDLHRGIGPPEEGLGQFRPVVKDTLDFQIGAAGAQRESGHALLMEHPLHLIHPHGHAAVRVLFDGAIHRKECAGAVMLGPVELDAAADPGSGQSHERRLDDAVVIDEMTLSDLVIGHLHPPAEFGEDHHLDVFVLEIHGIVRMVRLFIRDRLDHRIRIDHAAGSLIDPFLQENRILFGFPDLIGGDDHLLFPRSYHYLISSFSSCSRERPLVSGRAFKK